MSIYQGEKRVAENVTIDKSLYTMPVGSVIPYGSNTSPTGFLLCDGSEVSKEDYPDLYAVIGDSFGSATDGKFKLPDLRGKFVQGADGDLGTSKEAGLPNITGNFALVGNNNAAFYGNGQGAFTTQDSDYSSFVNGSGQVGLNSNMNWTFNASKSNSIYGNSTTVQPPAVCLSYIIKALKISDEPNDQYVTKPDLTQTLTNYYTKTETDEKVPTKVSDLENDTEFITATVDNLTNYYKKSDTYSQEEIQTLIGNLNHITISVVDALPTEDISTTTIYLIQISGGNDYDQYMYIDGSWAELGTTSVDLTNYATKDVATTTSDGLMSKEDKSKLDGIGGSDYTVFMQDTQPAEDGLWIKGEEKDFRFTHVLPQTNAFTKTLPDVTTPFAGACCSVTVNDEIYIFKSNDIYDFSPKSYGFTDINPTGDTFTISSASCVCINGEIYIFGSSRGGFSKYQYIYKLDPSILKRTKCTSEFPCGLTDTSAVAIDGYAYIFGGKNSDGEKDYIFKFDPSSDTLTTLSVTLPSAVSGFPAVAYNGKAYLFIAGSGVLEFDPVEETITKVCNVGNICSFSSATIIGSTAYIFGGKGSSKATKTIFKFDCVAKSITTLSVELPYAEYSGASSVWNGHSYIFSGISDSGSLHTVIDFVDQKPLSFDGYYIYVDDTTGTPTKTSAHEIQNVSQVTSGTNFDDTVKAYSIVDGTAIEL